MSALLLALPPFVAAGPTPLWFLASGMLMCFLRAGDFVLSPAPASFPARLLHLVSIFDTRRVTRREPGFQGDVARRLALNAAIAAAAFTLVWTPIGASVASRHAARWLFGGIAALALVEVVAATLVLTMGLLGLAPPPLHDAPLRSRTLGEFWAKRWNLSMATLLNERCFAPLARRGTLLALTATFVASAALHAYLAAVAFGAACALAWGAFFLAQPLFIVAERRLRVRRWSPAAGWAWTFGLLALLSPLFIEPFLRLFEAVL